MASNSYGKVSWLDKFKIFLTLCYMPVDIIHRLLLSPFRKCDQHRSWRRIASDGSFRYMSSRLRVNQMQYVMGTTPSVYAKWAKKNRKPAIIDDLGDGGSLMWFRPRKRQSGKVIFYLHGGTYQLPIQDYVPPFWLSILDEIRRLTGEEVAFVALSYSLYPTSSFPTQLAQAITALDRILSMGIPPRDIHFVGDSAGGALVLQVLSHLLHPFPDVPSLKVQQPFGGAFLMSPWVSLSTEAPSFTTNSDSDVLPKESWAYLATGILKDLPEEGKPYLEAVKAPEGWWDGLEKLVKKIAVHTGELECLRDDNITLVKMLKGHHGSISFMIQSGGVHTDPYLNRLAGEKDNKKATDFIVNHFIG